VSLTLRVEQMLVAAGLVGFFDEKPAPWHKLAKETRGFVVSHFPDGATVRPDDVAGALVPLLEVHEALGAYLQEHKLTQKYWIRYFADLIVDRSWSTINK
jgi:hypothetical protein